MFLKAAYCSILLGISAVGAQNQQFFDSDPESTPTLRRFSVNSDYELRRLLQTAQERNLDVWHANKSTVDIYSPTSSSFPTFDSPFTEWPIPSALTTVSHSEAPWDLPSFTNSSYHNSYRPLDQIQEFMTELSSLFPDLVDLVHIGRSAEQRDMFALEISKEKPELSRRDLKRKKAIVIMGSQHAREWISVSTALYLAHGLVANSSESYSLAPLLDRYDFYIIPMANPDGYKHTWEVDRFWYKTRQILSPKAKCVGIDMNRNWGYKFKSKFFWSNTPMDPCHFWYPGKRAFESPEVNNIANYVATLPNKKAFLDLRSYGQIISTPFSYSCKRVPKDAENQLEAALGAAQAIARVHATPYTTGSLCSTIYKAPGNVVDWMYKRAGIKYTFAVHLRDTGTYGFVLPAEWIRPVGEETAKMVEYIAKFITTVAP